MSASPESTTTFEEMFTDRFTATDEAYQEYVKRAADLPPIVEDWKGRTGGSRRSHDYRPYRGREDDRNRSNNRYDQQWHGRDGGYNRSGPQHQGHYNSYNQGSNSHWQWNHHRY
uniref:RNMT-activating mini protein n=1 Tax=Callorhinchus milii TaxID=7868 RepID=V9LF08_CALMI